MAQTPMSQLHNTWKAGRVVISKQSLYKGALATDATRAQPKATHAPSDALSAGHPPIALEQPAPPCTEGYEGLLVADEQ